MANTQAICNSFKTDVLRGYHALAATETRATTAADTIKAALYLTTATIDKNTTEYTPTGEVSGTNYTAGGVVVTNAVAPALDVDTAHWTPSASIVFTNVTLSTAFDAVLLYNDTFATKRAISVHTFGPQTVTAGDFTITMPVDDGTTGLVRIA